MRSWVNFLAVLFAWLVLLAAGSALAQELRIETGGRYAQKLGGVLPLIYGRLDDDSIVLYTDQFPLDKKAEPPAAIKQEAEPRETPKPTPTPKKTPVPELLPIEEERLIIEREEPEEIAEPPPVSKLDFPFQVSEKGRCTDTIRYLHFLELLNAFRSQVKGLVFSSGPGWATCARTVRASLEKRGFVVTRQRQYSRGALLSVVLRPIETASAKKRPRIEEPVTIVGTPIPLQLENVQGPKSKPATAAKVEQPVERRRAQAKAKAVDDLRTGLFINGLSVALQDGGWFVVEPDNLDVAEISVLDKGAVRFKKSLLPQIFKPGLSDKLNMPPIYKQTLITVDAPVTRIYVSPVETRSIVLNMTVDGGLGAGYNTPTFTNDVGLRYFAYSGLAKREVYGGTLDGSAMFSYRPKANFRASVLGQLRYLRSLYAFNEDLSISGGAGFAGFMSWIYRGVETDLKKIAQAQKELIPEQLSTLLVSVQANWRWGRWNFSPDVRVLPLYVYGAGLYMSTNGSFKATFFPLERLGIWGMLTSDEVQFPSVDGLSKVRNTAMLLGVYYDVP